MADEPVADLKHGVRLLAVARASHRPGNALADGEENAGLFERKEFRADVRLGIKIAGEPPADGIAAIAFDGELIRVDVEPLHVRREQCSDRVGIVPVERIEVRAKDRCFRRVFHLRGARTEDESQAEESECQVPSGECQIFQVVDEYKTQCGVLVRGLRSLFIDRNAAH
jgi:hypothetical protein